jgi:hypothetical protein
VVVDKMSNRTYLKVVYHWKQTKDSDEFIWLLQDQRVTEQFKDCLNVVKIMKKYVDDHSISNDHKDKKWTYSVDRLKYF